MAEIIVTGGYGFIGTHLLKHLLEQADYKITCIDNETYAAQKQHIQTYIKDNPQYRRRIRFIKKDISNYKQLEKIFESIKPAGVINVAAESHVDNSITGPLPFITTNIVGTFNLLECSRKFDVGRYLQVSTDEVYGQLHDDDEPAFTELNNLDPSSVYSSSKASADLLVQSYHRTFNLNTCITRCCNNYGPYQHKEKLLPKTILNALNNHVIPVYGKGENVREWIHAEDHSRAVLAVFKRGRPGQVYNVGTGETYNNITLVKMILSLVDRKEGLIEFVEDRKGHDFKYAIDCGKIANELGWSPQILFDDGIKQTIDWYKNYLDNILPC